VLDSFCKLGITLKPLLRAHVPVIGSSDNDPFDKRRGLWRPILPNRQLAKVCSFEQTAADDPAKISENLMDGRNVFASQKCITPIEVTNE
jgi:hypothetical protein